MALVETRTHTCGLLGVEGSDVKTSDEAKAGRGESGQMHKAGGCLSISDGLGWQRLMSEMRTNDGSRRDTFECKNTEMERYREQSTVTLQL